MIFFLILHHVICVRCFSVKEKKSENWFSTLFGRSEPKPEIQEQTDQQKDTRIIR